MAWESLAAAVRATPFAFSPWSVLQVPLLDEQLGRRGCEPLVTATSRKTPAGVGAARRRHRPRAAAGLDDRAQRRTTSTGSTPRLHAGDHEPGPHLARRARLLPRAVEPGRPPPDILLEHDLPEMLQALNGTGGKRIRPVHVATGAGSPPAAGQADEAAHDDVVRPGPRSSCCTCFALIHDDVMDESDVAPRPAVRARAGRPAPPSTPVPAASAQRFGESIAVLVGDLAHAEADHLVAELPRPMRADRGGCWSIELVRGQSRDLTGSAAGRRDLAHARQVARMKSGALHRGAPAASSARAAAGAATWSLDALHHVRPRGRRGVRAARRPARGLGRPVARPASPPATTWSPASRP